MEMRGREVLLAIAVPLSIMGAWFVGAFRTQAESTAFLEQALPQARHFDKVREDVYVGYARKGEAAEPVGYVATGLGTGYAGPIRIAMSLSNEGRIRAVLILRQTETVAFFRRVLSARFLESVTGKHCADSFRIGDDVQAVTGATVSLEGLTDAIRSASRQAARQAQIPVPAPTSPKIVLGLPEIVLLLLYGIGVLASGPAKRSGRLLRWVGLGLGLVFLGFWLNGPISLIHINALLLGYWPLWQSHFYWYLLLGGVLLPVVVTGRNIYCHSVCPFGAAQQVVGALGGTRMTVPGKIDRLLRWAQRLLAWAAIVCALVFRNPALVHYEVSGTLFSLTGALWQFVLLAVILVTSLIFTRPWCNYLCPIRAVADYIRLVRRSLRGATGPGANSESACGNPATDD
jgi:Na+-translocating ferredoxin:NAD+ oxidoreductase RnfG subunit